MKCSQVLKRSGSGYNWTKALELSLVPLNATTSLGHPRQSLQSAHIVSALSNIITVLLAIQSQFMPLQPHPFWVSACSATFPNLTGLNSTPPIDWDLQPKTQPTTPPQITEHKHIWTSSQKQHGVTEEFLSRGIMPIHLMFGRSCRPQCQGMKEMGKLGASNCITWAKYNKLR